MSGASAGGIASLLLLSTAGACEEPPAPEPVTWPPGTALAVEGVAIQAAEIDEVADRIAVIQPANATIKQRRDALTSFVLPRAAVAAQYAAEREEARARAAELLAYHRGEGGSVAGPPAPPVELDGGVDVLGFDLWGIARTLEVGAWSPLLEGIGVWRAVRVAERRPGASDALLEMRVSLLEIPYLPPDEGPSPVDRAVDASKLVIVDPEWETIVPLQFRHRMNAR